MTATPIHWKITCDHPSCTVTRTGYELQDRAALRRQLRKAGWACKANRDYCPEHAPVASPGEGFAGCAPTGSHSRASAGDAPAVKQDQDSRKEQHHGREVAAGAGAGARDAGGEPVVPPVRGEAGPALPGSGDRQAGAVDAPGPREPARLRGAERAPAGAVPAVRGVGSPVPALVPRAALTVPLFARHTGRHVSGHADLPRPVAPVERPPDCSGRAPGGPGQPACGHGSGHIDRAAGWWRCDSCSQVVCWCVPDGHPALEACEEQDHREADRLRRSLREAAEGKATPWEYDDDPWPLRAWQALARAMGRAAVWLMELPGRLFFRDHDDDDSWPDSQVESRPLAEFAGSGSVVERDTRAATGRAPAVDQPSMYLPDTLDTLVSGFVAPSPHLPDDVALIGPRVQGGRHVRVAFWAPPEVVA